MSPDLPYHISLAGTAALVILYFLIRSWTHGVLRPLATATSLGAGAAAAWILSHRAGPLLESTPLGGDPRVALGVAIVAGLLVFLALHRAGLAALENTGAPGTFAGRLLTGIPGAFISLLPALLVIAILALCLRRQGALAELRHVQTCSALHAGDATAYPGTPHAVKLRDALEALPRCPGLLDRVDPSSGPARRHLAGLALVSRNYALFLTLSRNASALEIYSHPRVNALLAELPVTKLLDRGDHRAVLAHPSLAETAALPGLAEKLRSIDVIDVLHEVLGIP